MRSLRQLAARVWHYARHHVSKRDVILVILIGVSMLFTVHYVASSNHKFCQVITSFTATAAQRPADPKADPSREQSYERYMRLAELGRSLGC